MGQDQELLIGKMERLQWMRATRGREVREGKEIENTQTLPDK